MILSCLCDSNYAKESTSWKSGKISMVEKTQVSVKYCGNSNGVEQSFVRSLRDISIVYFVGEMSINT